MQRDWTTFARFGAPAFGAAWPRFTPTGLQALSLVPPRPQVETDFVTEHQCAFWASLARLTRRAWRRAGGPAASLRGGNS